jgi:AraC-like DNA-binding protein
MLGLGKVAAKEVYAALDWLRREQPFIEATLARRHLKDGALLLYDVTSTYLEGRCCELAQYDYSRYRRGDRHRSILTRFEGLLHAQTFRGMTPIWAALGFSERTLRICCEEQLGMGPTEYVRRGRMQLVHRALGKGNPDAASISAVARRYGFRGLGRFAANYVWLPGGTFRMGSEDHYAEEAPVHRATVDAFWIDRTPVTNHEFRQFVKATGYVTVAETTAPGEGLSGRSPNHAKGGLTGFQPAEAPGGGFA